MNQIEIAKAATIPSQTHEWLPGERDEYDSLRHRGRTLYDNLRTLFDWHHDAAFETAAEEFGTKDI